MEEKKGRKKEKERKERRTDVGPALGTSSCCCCCCFVCCFCLLFFSSKTQIKTGQTKQREANTLKSKQEKR
jgi:hypothetical protein